MNTKNLVPEGEQAVRRLAREGGPGGCSLMDQPRCRPRRQPWHTRPSPTYPSRDCYVSSSRPRRTDSETAAALLSTPSFR